MWRRTVTDHMISHLTGLNRKPVDKGMVLHGYGNPKPVPIPGHTCYWISTVLPGPVSCLNHNQYLDHHDHDHDQHDHDNIWTSSPGIFFILFFFYLTDFFFYS